MKREKLTRKNIEYGEEKQTIPVYIPDTRYRALKKLSLDKNKALNKLVRDAIEEVFGEELDSREQGVLLDNDMHKSISVSAKADKRLVG